MLLVPDWLVMGMLKDRFGKEKRGFLFDGFPRTAEQAEALDGWLTVRSSSLDAAVVLKLSEAEASKRLGARRVCPGCGSIFNLLTVPTFMENMCDSCGGPLKPRDDDKAAALQKRLMVYRDYSEQIFSFYRGNVPILEVKADQPVPAVTTQILAQLKAAGVQ